MLGTEAENTARRRLSKLPAGPITKLRLWWENNSTNLSFERLVGLLYARHHKPGLHVKRLHNTRQPNVHHLSLAQEEDAVLTAFGELADIDRRILTPFFEWWKENAALGQGKLIEIFLSHELSESLDSSPQVQAKMVGSGLRIEFSEKDLDALTPFSSRLVGQSLHIYLNTSHPAFPLLQTVVREKDQVPARALLAAWALLEHDAPEGQRRDRISEARLDWGRVLRRLLNDEGLKTCIEI